MDKFEQIDFAVHLEHTSGSKKPEVKVFLNEELMFHDSLQVPANVTQIIRFQKQLAENQAHTITIELCNKDSGDTKVDDIGNIVEDWLLAVENIFVDDISLDYLLWSESRYYPNYPDNYLDEQQKSVAELTECVHLGWNGKWQLSFTSPFYLWLLERI
jgi:hypothetical protein